MNSATEHTITKLRDCPNKPGGRHASQAGKAFVRTLTIAPMVVLLTGAVSATATPVRELTDALAARQGASATAPPTVVVGLGLALAPTKPVSTLTLASPYGNGKWSYRDLDISQLKDVRDPVLSKDGTALQLKYTNNARHQATLTVDLTRKDRYYVIDRPESRAIHDALRQDAGCNPSPGQPELGNVSPPISRQRCITTFQPAEAVSHKEGNPPRSDAMDWKYYRVALNPELYLPALQFAPLEQVFPGRIDTLDKLIGGKADSDTLLHNYISHSTEHWKKNCVVYYKVVEYPGTWLLEFWFYYPFDVGQQGGHLHDGEHVFVEVDVLGGWVRRIMGAGHGALAGNNIYDATKHGAAPADLPLLVMVEMGKHATAPDIDRDFVFTPGIDENYYGERAKSGAFGTLLAATTTTC